MSISRLILLASVILLVGRITGYLAELSELSQSVCEVRFSGTFKELSQAMVCGTPLKKSPIKAALIHHGLIHVIVVSGSHLIFIESLIQRFLRKQKKYFFVTALLLSLFWMMTGLQPPCGRALFQIVLTRWSSEMHLHWSPLLLNLFSGLVSLMFFPEWISSLSFLLSWCCALALSVAPRSSLIKQNLIISSFLFPFVLHLAVPSAFSLLLNILLVPIIGGVLFPVCLAVWAFPSLAFFSNAIWRALSDLLMALPRFELDKPFHASMKHGLFYLMILWGWLYLQSVKQRKHTLWGTPNEALR